MAQITPEMAIGQLIQNQITQQALIEQNSRALSNLRADADRLITHTKLPARTAGKRKTKVANTKLIPLCKQSSQ